MVCSSGLDCYFYLTRAEGPPRQTGNRKISAGKQLQFRAHGPLKYFQSRIGKGG